MNKFFNKSEDKYCPICNSKLIFGKLQACYNDNYSIIVDYKCPEINIFDFESENKHMIANTHFYGVSCIEVIISNDNIIHVDFYSKNDIKISYFNNRKLKIQVDLELSRKRNLEKLILYSVFK